jgi:chromate transporter
MMALAAVYTKTHNLPVVISAFNGLQTIIVAIIANATLSFGKTTLKNRLHFVIAGIAALLFGLNVNPILVILLTTLGGLALIKPKYPIQFQADTALEKSSTLKPLLLILSCAAVGFLYLFIFQRNLFELAVLLLRIDLFAFGGGFTSVPLMFHEIVEVHSWFDSPTFMNGIVLGQVTPGPIVITATFIGYLLYGPFGGLIATISIFLPSFAMVIGVTPYFDQLRASPYFNRIIKGVLCSFVGLLFTVTIRFAWNIHWDLTHLLLGSAAFIALLLKVDILWVVLAGVLISVAIFFNFQKALGYITPLVISK